MTTITSSRRNALIRSTCLGLAALCSALVAPAAAQTGVSDERVVLPDGPGSIGGIGENVEINAGMGLMSFSVPIQVPQGIENATPDLDLAYSSGSGQGIAGIGWDLDMARIERATFRGVPAYDEDDLFAFDGGEELVRVGEDGGAAVYRARFESGFVRYKWLERGDGAGGYWTAEFPDGRIGYFGADPDGNEVESARATSPNGGVFAYHLVALVDTWGHRIEYRYTKHGETPLLDTISYAFDAQDRARFVVSFVYESREDVISDAKPGFEVLLEHRLATIRIASRGQEVRRYELSYEDYEAAGGSTRLSNVTEFGRGGVAHPNSFSFEYSRALGGTCEDDCEKPYVVDMGTLPGGVDISTGRATLIDINGDSLPDVLNTSSSGEHTFYISQLSEEGRPSFTDETVESSQTRGGSPFTLGAPGVQVLDVNGDGYTDIVASRTPAVLCNDGSGDWNGDACLMDATLPVLDADDPGEADPRNVRFLDFDNDKRIDMIRTTAGQTEVFANDGERFVAQLVDDIGAIFDESTLQLADMNGDGLNDPVELLTGGVVRYRLNLGRGRWTDWIEVTLDDFDETALLGANLEDINGDGLADVVVVAGNEVQYALNRNGNRFDAVVTVASGDVDGDLPERTSTTTVTFADMNGNGTDDIVWITNSGNVRFLEMFPVRPNLLSRIDNGIGWIQDVTYGTSIAEQARDQGAGEDWKYKLPTAMTVVKSVDDWVTLSANESGGGLHEVETFDYHHGYYDGIEKKFRGFERVERTALADNADSQEPGRAVLHYDVGQRDAYYAGLPVKQQLFGGEDFDRPLQEQRWEYDDCDLDTPESGLTRPVRYVCPKAVVTILQEGAPEARWATTRKETEYDPYGNETKVAELGVVHMGPPEKPRACGACGAASGPCGEECRGDESFIETDYVVPGPDTGDRWILNKPYREITYGEDGGPREEVQTFYDGPAFEGLPAGELRRGSISRVLERDSEGNGGLVAVERYAYDEKGNVIDSLDALGDPDDSSGHRRRYTYDASGLDLVSAEILLSDADGDYSLRRQISYEDAYGQVSEATAWMLVRDGKIETPRNSTRYRYDPHGRLASVLLDGDRDDSPAREYVYDLGSPASRIIRRGHSRVGGEADIEEVTCIDGRGREFQTRTLIADDRYQVSGFTEFNSRGQPVRVYQPYVSMSADCDMAAPEDVPFTRYRYDFLGREIEVTLPDEGMYDTPSVTRTAFEPLATVSYDEEDTAEDSAHADTPTRVRVDGLGRVVAVERLLEADGEPAVLKLEYDSLGRLTAYEDPEGNRREQTYDLSGQVLSVEDPNSGTTSYTYDPQGNRLSKTDAAGVVTRYAYDGDNRIAAEWDEEDEEGTRVEFRYDFADDCDECSNVAGRLAEARYPLRAEGVSGTGIDRFGYDGRSQLVYSERVLEGHSFITRAEYDNEGRATLKEYPDGQRIERTYDGVGRVTSLAGVIDAIEYNARANPSKVEYANGVSTTYAYDGLLRLSRLATSRGDDVMQAFRYTRDRADNILTTTDEADEREGRIRYGAKYTYDAWYRLLESEFDTDADAPEKVTSSYNTIDNILSRVSSLSGSAADSGKYEYDAMRPNAAVKVGRRELSYDEVGRAIKRGPAELHWDFQNRLRRVERDGKVTGEFVYAGGTERVMKLERGGVTYYIQPDFEVRDGIGVLHPQALERRVARLQSDDLQARLLSDLAPATGKGDSLSADGDGAITAADAWLAHAAAEEIVELDGAEPSPAERLLKAAARRLLFANSPSRVFLHHDEAESIVLATDGDGEVLGERAFYPGGEVRAETGYVDEYGYTGQERDESTGLLHFESRYLDPSSSRWLSPDPLFAISTPENMVGGMAAIGAYSYADNNPINRIDPTGLEPKKAPGAAKHAASKKKTSASGKTKTTSSKTKSSAKSAKASRATASAAVKSAANQQKAKKGGNKSSAKPAAKTKATPSSAATAKTPTASGATQSATTQATSSGGGGSSNAATSNASPGSAAASSAGAGNAASAASTNAAKTKQPTKLNATQKRDIGFAVASLALGAISTGLSIADIASDDDDTGDNLDSAGLAFDAVSLVADVAAAGFLAHAIASKDKGAKNNSAAPTNKSSRKKGSP